MLRWERHKCLILLASPAGFEPATCGLEIRCCYPTELRGRDGEAFTPRSPSSASAAKGRLLPNRPPISGMSRCRRRVGIFPYGLSARCETGVISHDHESKHPSENALQPA